MLKHVEAISSLGNALICYQVLTTAVTKGADWLFNHLNGVIEGSAEYFRGAE